LVKHRQLRHCDRQTLTATLDPNKATNWHASEFCQGQNLEVPMRNSVSRVLSIATLILAIAVSAQATENVLFSFTGANGAGPDGSLVSDSQGNLYGTTLEGGSSSNCPQGCGTLFKLAPGTNGTWEETVLHSFAGGDDGVNPYAGLVFDSHGSLYGTTFFGGGTSCTDSYGDHGCGIVFMLSPSGNDWKETILYRFKGGNNGDGSGPFANVVFDTQGNLYGTTLNGGDQSCLCGTVFELTSNSDGTWKEKILHKFAGGSNDGANPYGGVIFGAQGELYGTTYNGGNYGTVFQLTSESGGWKIKLIHIFQGGHDGGDPYAGVILDSLGNVYGTSSGGTAFELTPDGDTWTETVLYYFGDAIQFPTAPLVFDKADHLYGMCLYGGPDDYGAVFELTKSSSGTWAEDEVVGFSGSNGDAPYYAALIVNSKGDLYGVTAAGGTANNGVVYEITQ
jgi:uncharacterized repeat protein (TIGR03803 family)